MQARTRHATTITARISGVCRKSNWLMNVELSRAHTRKCVVSAVSESARNNIQDIPVDDDDIDDDDGDGDDNLWGPKKSARALCVH